MNLIEQIKADRECPQVRLMSMKGWRVKSDEPAPGWVKVVGPCIPVQCPTLATDLNGEDYIARHAEARRIARVPDMEAALIAAEELAGAIDAYETAEAAAGDTGCEDDYYFVFECWDVVQAKKDAYRAATGAT